MGPRRWLLAVLLGAGVILGYGHALTGGWGDGHCDRWKAHHESP